MYNTVITSGCKCLNIKEIKKSYGRSLAADINNKKFLVRFYELFLSSDPEIRSMFLQTNILKQVNALKNGIDMVIEYEEKKGGSAGDVMEHIRDTHSPKNLGVTARHYQIWEDCLINVLSEYDQKFNSELESDWRTLIKQTVNYLLK